MQPPDAPQSNPYSSPTQPQPQWGPQPVTGDATGGLIPYKNPQALIAYYVGIFALFPCLALVLGPIAVVLGIIGFNRYRQTPIIHGAVHAWIGIVLGGVSFLLNLLVLILVLVGSAVG